ncbi:MAG: heme ABC exporter ATP-binding protein CcmA [Alphaproteobacteria bacterium]
MRLSVENLAVARGMRTIFNGVTFSVQSGEALVLVGPNGVGKTTLLRTLAGFLPAVAGRVRVEGGEASASVGEQSHYVGHLNGVKHALNVAENLYFSAKFLSDAPESEYVKQAEAAGDALGLTELADVTAGYLSAGQKRRLGLARLLCAKRPVWLLDEPAVSLDTDSQAILARMVAKHLDEGGIVVSVTHTPLGWTTATTMNLGEHVAATPAEIYTEVL